MSSEKEQKKGSLIPSAKRETTEYSSDLITRGLELSKIIELEQKEGVVKISLGDLEATLLTEKGWGAIKAGDYSKAVEFYKRAIRFNPDLHRAHNGLGIAYDFLNRYREAIRAYKQAIRINPNYAQTHNNLGMTYHVLGRYSEAIKAFKQAIQIHPDFSFAHHCLGWFIVI